MMNLEALPAPVLPEVDPSIAAPAIKATPHDAQRHTGVACSYRETFSTYTSGMAPAFFDLTEAICALVRRSGVLDGQVVVSTAHTTCALIVQENEPLLLRDLAERLQRFAAPDEDYRHNRMDVRTINVCGLDECANGHSHCQHALLGGSATLPVVDGDLLLGRWQRLLLVELDHPRPRDFTAIVTGIAPAR